MIKVISAQVLSSFLELLTSVVKLYCSCIPQFLPSVGQSQGLTQVTQVRHKSLEALLPDMREILPEDNFILQSIKMGVNWTEPVCTLLGIFCRLFLRPRQPIKQSKGSRNGLCSLKYSPSSFLATGLQFHLGAQLSKQKTAFLRIPCCQVGPRDKFCPNLQAQELHMTSRKHPLKRRR